MTKMAVTPGDNSIHRISKSPCVDCIPHTHTVPTGAEVNRSVYRQVANLAITYENKKLSHCRGTALQGALVLAKSGRMGLGYDIL